MGKEFTSAQKLFQSVIGDVKNILASSEPAMRAVGNFVKIEAQAKIGEYQGSSGPFVAWAPLADSTKVDRTQHGYPDDEPLLRDGTLRNAIVDEAEPMQALIGVKGGEPLADGKHDIGDVAVWMEHGTAMAPARPFLGPALFESRDEIGKMLSEYLIAELQRKL